MFVGDGTQELEPSQMLGKYISPVLFCCFNYGYVCRLKTTVESTLVPLYGFWKSNSEVIRLMRLGKNVCHIILVKAVTQLFLKDFLCPLVLELVMKGFATFRRTKEKNTSFLFQE